MPEKSQLANAPVTIPPSEWPPHSTLVLRYHGGSWLMTVYSSCTVWARPTWDSHAAFFSLTKPANFCPSTVWPP